MASPSDVGFANASPPSTAPLASSSSSSSPGTKVASSSSKLSAAASVAPPNRTIRSAAKSKGRDIVKPSALVYESSGGPLIRATLKALLELFQTKIAEPNPSHEDHILIDQVLITHKYWTSTLDIIKCFTRAIAKAQADASEATVLPIVLTRVCNTFKTFLTYFDVSPYDSAIDELLQVIKSAHPPMQDIVQALVTNNIAAFAKHASSVAAHTSTNSHGPSSPSQSHSTSSSKTAALDSSSESSSSTASSTAGGTSSSSTKSSSSRPGTPGRVRARGDSNSTDHGHAHHISVTTPSGTGKSTTPLSAAAATLRAKSPSPAAIANPALSHGSNSSGSLMTGIAPHAGGPGHLTHTSSTVGVSYTTRETSFDLPDRPSFSHNPSAFQNPSGYVSLTNVEMPELEVLADQMALADYTVFSQCIITDFMNASFLKNKAPGNGIRSTNTVANYIEHTNLTTRWIAGKILLCPTSRARGKMITYFIRLMELLKDRQDYTGMINIFTTLNTNSIWKLRKSWKHVDSKRNKAFARFEVIVQPMINFSGYRDILAKSKPPAVPALAILTKDLVAIEEQPTFVEDDEGNPTSYLNWVKFGQIANVLTEQFLRLSRLGYTSEPLDGLFEELYDPFKIGGLSASTVADRHGQSPSSSPSPFTSLSGAGAVGGAGHSTQDISPRVLLTDEEIAAIADRLDLEEQGLAPAPSATPSSGSLSTQQQQQSLGGSLGRGSNGLQRRISPLRIYLGSSAMASPLMASLTGSVAVGASSPLQGSKKGGHHPPPFTLTPSVVSYAPPTNSKDSHHFQLQSGGWSSMEESVDHLPSVSLLRRIITHSMCTAHSVTESLSEAQRSSYENQPIQQQRDVYIRMLRLLDLSVKYSNASIFANYNYALAQQSGESIFSGDSRDSSLPSASPNPFSHQSSGSKANLLMHGKGGMDRDPLTASSSGGASGGGAGSSSMSSGSYTSSLEALGPLGSKYTGPTEGITQAFINESRGLDLPNPHSHLIETLAESVRIFQKFDGVTKVRNMLRPTQQQNTGSIGQSLLSENRGVLAEFSLPVRTLIHAFIATGSCYFSEVAHRAAAGSAAPATTPSVFFACASNVERVGISLQISIANVDSALPTSMVSLPSAGVGGSARTFVQRTLSCLPPALAELFLPFESILAATSASVGWFPDPSEEEVKSTKEEKKKDKDKSNDSKSTNSDEMFDPLSSSSTVGALVMHLTLPLGSFASTLQSSLGASQKRFLASKITGLNVENWKVEHVVTWLYLTGMQSLCSKFESQSVSGAELADLEPQDFESMGIRMSPQQSKLLIQNIRNLVKAGIWDGQIAGEVAPNTATTPVISRAGHYDEARGSSSEEDSEDDQMNDTVIRKQGGRPGSRNILGGSTSGTSSPHRSGSLKNITGSPVNARLRNKTRMRVLEGAKSGIVKFSKESDFCLKNLLDKATALFNPAAPYVEDAVYVTYYDLDGDGVSLSTSQTFQRQSEMVWEDLRKEGSIDVVYASITLKQQPQQQQQQQPGSSQPGSLSSSLSSYFHLASSLEKGGSVGGNVASPSASGTHMGSCVSPLTGLSPLPSPTILSKGHHPAFPVSSSESSSTASPLSTSAPPTASKEMDFDIEYAQEKGIMMILENSGKIRWISPATQATITCDEIVNRNIDHFLPESMYEMLTPFRTTGASNVSLATLIATDKGISQCQLSLTLIPGQSSALWAANFTMESEADLKNPSKTIDLPKLRETASKSNAAILAFSQRYGLVQYSNRLGLKLFASESLQGSHISTILPHGTPSTPGETTLPIQKKDGSLAVHTFNVRQFSTASDTLVVLTATNTH